MKRAVAVAVAAAALVGCASAESARVLAPGRTQLTVAAAGDPRVAEASASERRSGAVMVRRGLGPRTDAGLVLGRTGLGWFALAVEPKVQLTPARGRLTLSVALAAGVAWTPAPELVVRNARATFDLSAYLLVPAAYVGIDLAPTVELMVAPKLYLAFPDEAADRQTRAGATVGVRFADRARTLAVQPELGLLHGWAGPGETTVMVGLSVAAGD